MALLPVIPDVYRIELQWQASFAAPAASIPVNILHVRAASGTVSEIGDAFGDSLANPMFECMTQDLTLTSIFVTPLDGVTAGQFVGITTQNPGGNTEASPASAGVVSLRSTQRGPQGRGRVFLGPCAEDQIRDGLLDEDVRTTMADTPGWGGFIARLAAQTEALELGIASYQHEAFYPVSSIVINRRLGTQKRRQDRVA